MEGEVITAVVAATLIPLALIAAVLPSALASVEHAKLKRAAARLGLRARVDGYALELEGTRAERALLVRVVKGQVDVTVRGLHTPARLAFEAARAFRPLEVVRSARAPDVQVGDPLVDDNWTLDGPEPGFVRALLSQPSLREHLAGRRRLALSPGGVLEVGGVPGPNPDLAQHVERALALADLLESLADLEPADVPARTLPRVEAPAAASSSGAPLPVPTLTPPDR